MNNINCREKALQQASTDSNTKSNRGTLFTFSVHLHSTVMLAVRIVQLLYQADGGVRIAASGVNFAVGIADAC